MKQSTSNQALKTYQKSGGNFSTISKLPLKKESDLASYYFPGISAIVEKIQKKPDVQSKYCSYHRTVGVISTSDPYHYPVLTARAALLSHVTGANAIPLMIRYGKVKRLPDCIKAIASNFRALYCTDLSTSEREIMAKAHDIGIPVLYQDQMESAAIMASILSASKMLKKSLKKIAITIEGSGPVVEGLIQLLRYEKSDTLTILDERGPLYKRRPNMNHFKNSLVTLLGLNKDARTREQALQQTDIYIFAQEADLEKKTTEQLPDKAVIITLKSLKVDKKPKQSLISTLPTLPNHLTDLHITAGIIDALVEGKSFQPDTIHRAIKALSEVYKTPSTLKLMPGLLEKNLSKKIAKGIK
ncbi:MAG: hypothetical protein Q8O95_01540 [bacterium]|nr:hypothetical protein [bacterium]